MTRKSMVTLIAPDGMTQEFTPEHAERLLRMPRNGGWRLSEETPFTYSSEHGIEPKRNTRKNRTPPPSGRAR